MPKLLQINVCSAVLSTGKIVEDISKVAARHGWETYSAWGRYAESSVSTQLRVGNGIHTLFHYAGHKLFDSEGLASKNPTRRLVQQIEMINPDIIHIHNIHDHYLNYPLLFKYLSQKQTPVVWTQHDCWSFTGGCMYYDLQNCSKWKTGCTDCPEHRAIISDKTEKQFSMKRDLISDVDNLTFVPVCDWLGNALKESIHKDKPMETIHNGVDTSVFRPSGTADGEKFRILGVAAVWDKRKGLDDFIKLRRLLPDNFEITLVGLSGKQLKELPEGIKGLSRTTDVQELVKLYSESDVFVNPTYSDCFPSTNIEALACGTPIITYRTGGSPEAVDDCTGAVIDQGDIEGLAGKVKEFESGCFKQIHTDDCRKRAEEKFDKDYCFEKYFELYNRLMK